MRKKIKVLIVEDSLVVRELLKHIIGSDERFEVMAAVTSAEDCLEMLETQQPDVISLDIRLPGMNGLDATLKIMSRRPTPIVVVAAQVDDNELNIAMNALRAGALSVVEKPVGVTNAGYDTMAAKICTQLAIMSQVQVVRQGINRGLNFGSDDTPARVSQGRPGTYSMVGIVASTGGPQALVQLLGGLGADFPLPILLVQHITSSFLEGFVTWLSGTTPFEARIAQDGEKPVAGKVYVAPVDHHLGLVNDQLVILDLPAVCNQKPSGTVLFGSMARDIGKHGIGVVLTGMGADGSEGLRQMADKGAYTIVEDASTCVVNGMPAAAAKLGAARETLPLPAIAARLRDLALGGEK
ncbi:chemotaxis protein CheB [Paramagnetospirillum magneticum]|uniref:Protein-glutamate methylesterase/protein-glutamine glutaminase 2 n=1 Tax=Paramagnetospirillum magneticum (strain ATCC 700264 / AMB-1) TaxID=342108 RepID=CHEB2_PARM1|nr:chemotaxis protein CheB [Paramagnetospirillum magneticum]Q2W5V5.1 RecName: Full=Protein-glutamate methylesterase/protein-glutamine glutaminase 2 [Paramagnetospirillum magneticum AMB-1]BAE50770.1 Chemotaxis response regulator [Paramagnetospirillum magneticum AMB-1]